MFVFYFIFYFFFFLFCLIFFSFFFFFFQAEDGIRDLYVTGVQTCALPIFCWIISFLFSGIEAGLLALNPVRLRHRAKSGDGGAQRLQRMLKQPERDRKSVV